MVREVERQDDLSEKIAFYDGKDVHRQTIKWLRDLSHLNHTNQFSASIEVIGSFSLLIDSLFSFLKEKALEKAYLENVKVLYPKEFGIVLKLWASFLQMLDGNIVRLF